jgi:hypothetical protein
MNDALYMKRLFFLVTIIILTACNKPSTIEVQNNISEAKLKNVYWGEIPLAYEILPEETSGKVKIYEDAQYNLDFPEEFPLSFYVELNGADVLLQTDASYKLEKESDLFISINDSTEVSELKD